MSGAASSPSKVSSLVQKHESAIRASSPATSPSLSRTSNPLSPPTAPKSPTPASKTLPAIDSLKLDTADASSASATSSSKATSPAGSMSSSLILEDIKEGEQLKIERLADEEDSSDGEVSEAMTESQLFPAKEGDDDDSQAQKADGDKAGEKKAAEESPKDGKAVTKGEDKAAAPETSPLDKLRELLNSLPAQEQEIVRKNLESIQAYPDALPLSAPWSEWSISAFGSAN